MDYKMEELFPLVCTLAQNYSGHESTSVTYEKAQMLMGAVLYCLEEYHHAQENGLVQSHTLIKEQYDTGAGLVYEKVKNIQKIFHELSFYFEDYNVKCLHDTVLTGIPQFLKWYDIKFNPQNTIVTLDYPLLIDCCDFNGADAVYRYLSAIQAEQRFLGIFEKEYVISVLKHYNPQYKDMVENICDPVITNTIGHIAVRKTFQDTGFQSVDYLRLEEIFQEKPVSEIEKFIVHILSETVNRQLEQDADQISEYLCCGAENIAVRIKSASRHHALHRVFVI